ncbi:MAG TPA: TetR family transcriptional regulator [Trebonia sp.]|nr:TetR family transcriptional regulator [Trebonia sp.]
MTDVDLKHHGSLRERKKAKTRAAIREHALRLFREQGYQATTVEQIAAAAEVSPSTFFRYFPTKEDVVLRDDLDTRLLEAFSRQPPDLAPLPAIRAATRDALDSFGADEMAQIRETTELMLTVPEIRARAMDEFARTMEVIAEAIAKRAGRSPADLAIRTLSGAIVGVIMSVTMPWSDWTSEQATADLLPRIDEALALLESGLPL